MEWSIAKLLFQLLQLGIFSSVSCRSPNIDVDQFDYEIRGGFQTEWTYCYELYERENAEYYRGHLYKVDIWRFHFQDFYREANEIQMEAFDVLYPVKFIEIGAAYVLNDWKDGKVCASVRGDKKYAEVEYRQGEAYYNLSSTIKYPIDIKSFTLVPKLTYYGEEDKRAFWQAKVSLYYDF